MGLDINFALEGFRIIKRRPALIPIWGGVMLVAIVIMVGALITGMIPFITAAAAGNSNQIDPARAAGMALGLMAPMLLSMIVMILAASIVQCAIYRAALEDTPTSFGYLKLGSEELRNILVNFLFVLVAFGVELMAGTAAMLGGGLLGLALSLIHKDLMALGFGIGVIAAVIGYIWVLMRLSLFSVQSFDQKKINLFGSWKLTQGNSGTLIIGYLIAAVLAMVIHMIISFFLILLAAGVAFGGVAASGLIGQATTPDAVKVLTAVAPGIIIYVLGLGLILAPTLVTITAAAPVGAYKTLAGIRKNSAEDVF